MIELTVAAETVEFRLLMLAFILAGPILAERVKVALIFLGMVVGGPGRPRVSNRANTQNLVGGGVAFEKRERRALVSSERGSM